MFSEDDLIDIIFEAVAQRRSPTDWRPSVDQKPPEPARAGKWGFHVRKPFNEPWTSLPMKRPFLSEHAVRQMVKKENTKVIRVPVSAILSPLAEEWLAINGVVVKRVSS